jgi:hypothetical protein
MIDPVRCHPSRDCSASGSDRNDAIPRGLNARRRRLRRLRQACLAQESRVSHEPPQLPPWRLPASASSNSVFLKPIKLEINAQIHGSNRQWQLDDQRDKGFFIRRLSGLVSRLRTAARCEWEFVRLDEFRRSIGFGRRTGLRNKSGAIVGSRAGDPAGLDHNRIRWQSAVGRCSVHSDITTLVTRAKMAGLRIRICPVWNLSSFVSDEAEYARGSTVAIRRLHVLTAGH